MVIGPLRLWHSPDAVVPIWEAASSVTSGADAILPAISADLGACRSAGPYFGAGGRGAPSRVQRTVWPTCGTPRSRWCHPASLFATILLDIEMTVMDLLEDIQSSSS